MDACRGLALEQTADVPGDVHVHGVAAAARDFNQLDFSTERDQSFHQPVSVSLLLLFCPDKKPDIDRRIGQYLEIGLDVFEVHEHI